MKFDTESTICAIATGSEGAYRGAIRVTGADAVAVAAKAFPNRPESTWTSNGAVRFQETISLDRLGLLPVDIFVWPDSRSYTGQPSVELHCLGNTIVLQSIQARLIECGAVLAQPGEFTLRAFLAGRLDLTQCEAVLGVIHAANDRSLNIALSQLAGGLSQPLSELRRSLVNLLADIEAGLDFVDEDIAFISKSQISDRLASARSVVESLLQQMESRAAQTVQLQVAIVGAPNAGKSSLVNAIAEQNVSIVSSEPGTTRDYVRIRLDLDGVQIDILDTAGIEEADSTTPRGMAQQFTREQIDQADLILYCLSVEDCDDDGDAGAWANSHLLNNPKTQTWLLHTKCDLTKCDLIVGRSANHHRSQHDFMLSTRERASIERLIQALRAWALERQESVNQVVPITAARCQASLTNAIQAIAHAQEATLQSRGDEIIASEIRLALEEIGLVAGTVYTDDILDALFSRFCIGK
jgi:tRNA modification GTPase